MSDQGLQVPLIAVQEIGTLHLHLVMAQQEIAQLQQQLRAALEQPTPSINPPKG